MQFVENSVIGVRAAYHKLSATQGWPEVCLFPMIHAGSSAYYVEINRRLENCDLVLFEGVRSLRARILTLVYAIAARRKRLGLVLQSKALDISRLQQDTIRADVNAEEFATTWARIPLHQRMVILLVAPVFGLWLYLTASRERIGRSLGTEELESRRDLDRFESAPELEMALVTTRDARLVREIESALSENSAYKRIGIVYGAAHMRVVSRLLSEKYKYRVVESEWIMVFGYNE